jgi:epoxyqueuosine reductase
MMPPDDIASTRQDIVREAERLGFDRVGIVAPDAIAGAAGRFADFLDAGWHGDMAWLRAKADRRMDPRVLWADVRSIIVVAMNYGPEEDPRAVIGSPTLGAVSVYAQGRDYHDVLKGRMKRFGRWISDRTGAGIKVFVDTAPVLEKPLAAAAGIGWQGKHTNVVSRDFGSWLFLGEVFTTLELPPDPPGAERCGSCRRCLDVCPTDAFPAPFRLDARRCISYLTIEHRGHIDRQFRRAIGNRIYGCDDCLAACPWNRFARVAAEMAFRPRPELRAPALRDLVRLDDAAFRRLFAGSPVKRLGRNRFVRNVLIGLGNSGDPGALPDVVDRLEDPSPEVRAMAVWAFRMLASPSVVNAERIRRRPREADPAVAAEWDATDPTG